MATNTTSKDLYNPETRLRIRFDKGVEGASGFEAVDHYHIYNSNYTNKKVDLCMWKQEGYKEGDDELKEVTLEFDAVEDYMWDSDKTEVDIDYDTILKISYSIGRYNA